MILFSNEELEFYLESFNTWNFVHSYFKHRKSEDDEDKVVEVSCRYYFFVLE